MNPLKLIRKKRDGHRLTHDEIRALIDGYVSSHVHDYHMAAWAMAVYFRGLDLDETTALAEAMWRSGDTLRRPANGPPRVDKHSTGGIGDKVSLVLAPLLAAAGAAVPMLAGHGLGPTGGTLDKLESIAGFRTDLSAGEIEHALGQVGCVITGQTAELAPADRKLYALRDVTGTVESIPLITASILSKKLAEALDCLVLDVKWGSGAFIHELDGARELATSLVTVASRLGLACTALVTDMNQPLGRMIGNAVEVHEAIDSLRGGGPADLRSLVLELGALALAESRMAPALDDTRTTLSRLLDDGSAYERFERMVASQGGRLELPLAVAGASDVTADTAGFVARIDTRQLGHAVIDLGGGRRRLHDAIDHAVGFEMLVRLGDQVERAQPLVRIFAPHDKAAAVRSSVSRAIEIADQPLANDLPLIVERVE